MKKWWLSGAIILALAATGVLGYKVMTKVTNSPITKTFHNIAIRATVDGDAAGVKLLESKDFPTGGTWHGS